ncbi:cationic amino acid transporter 4-like isoform X2 [Argopecten irradians]|uniref:cationic amino acid transporter 4-like isoform X2 n=1 Tax=Argopecten irradians TaxID=31199 RepID=UPI0037220947
MADGTMGERMREGMTSLWLAINRKKTITDDFHDTPLKRCLNTFDITLLGIGHMIGAGIYVLSGTVVKDLAGPSAVLSFLFAGFAAILSALCYAEFGAKVPKAGSAYSYTYVTLGELWGFIIGWNIVLEHLLGASAIARAFSGALDSVFNGAIRNSTLSNIGTLSKNSEWLSEYPDFIAFSATIIVFIVVGTGAKFTMNFNNVFTVLNMTVLVFLICVGFYFADIKNWENAKTGGFFPHGFAGCLSGAATCFFAYIGFEGIATAGEEAKNPERSIPISTVTSLGIVTFLYIMVTAALTLMIPYQDVDPTAAFPHAFAMRSAEWAKYIVAIGTLFGITTSLLGSAFSLPRTIYAMASDGLLFSIFAYIYPRTQTPIWGVFTFGMISALMSLLFEIETLVEFMSIGTLMAYTLVAASVIILRYLPANKCQFKLKPEGEGEEIGQPASEMETEESSIIKKSKSHDDFGRLKEKLKSIPLLRSFEPGNASLLATFLILVFIVCFCSTLIFGFSSIEKGAWWAIFLVILFGIAIIACFLVMIAHEKNDAFTTFSIPFVPLIPILSMFCNIALMLNLNYLTWIRLGIWMAVGLTIYFSYGLWHSHEARSTNGYGEIVHYTGDANISCSTISNMNEEILEQQPARNPNEDFQGGM